MVRFSRDLAAQRNNASLLVCPLSKSKRRKIDMTTQTQTHTPTPYAVSRATAPQSIGILAETECIASVHDLGIDRRVEQRENAAFIVRCVNAHDKLVEALKTARLEIAELLLGRTETVNATCQQLDAALRLAKGKE
jgi:hypothetical protein